MVLGFYNTNMTTANIKVVKSPIYYQYKGNIFIQILPT